MKISWCSNLTTGPKHSSVSGHLQTQDRTKEEKNRKRTKEPKTKLKELNNNSYTFFDTVFSVALPLVSFYCQSFSSNSITLQNTIYNTFSKSNLKFSTNLLISND